MYMHVVCVCLYVCVCVCECSLRVCVCVCVCVYCTCLVCVYVCNLFLSFVSGVLRPGHINQLDSIVESGREESVYVSYL